VTLLARLAMSRNRRPTLLQRHIARMSTIFESSMSRTSKRERWTEAEVLSLPVGEHDYFERKGAGFLTDHGFREDLAKVTSALANSGGGHLVIGVSNDGRLEGVEPRRGRTSTREWLEQVISPSVSPGLADFRVHEVEPSTAGSAISPRRVVLVVDISDSMLAPHQAEPVLFHISADPLITQYARSN
jgi:hypothetical protein